jgi:hypothetical protein
LVDAITNPVIKADVSIDDVDINKVWAEYDSKKDETHYMAELRYRKATKGKDVKETGGDRNTNVDITSQVLQQQQAGGGWLSSLYAQDNAAVVYGLELQNTGKTPFDPKTNYEGALQTHGAGLLSHKYQIVSVRDPKTKGVSGYKAFVAIPLGKDDNGKPRFQVVPVPNFHKDASGGTTMFPANFEGVRLYMEGAFSNTDAAQDFYARLGIPYNQ